MSGWSSGGDGALLTRRELGRRVCVPMAFLPARRVVVCSGVPLRPGRTVANLSNQGLRWSYQVHAPAVVMRGEPLPVVLILHGSGGTGATYLDRAGWADQAERSGFLAVAPDAQRVKPGGLGSNATNPRRWNSGQIAPDSERARIDDVEFLVALLEEVGRRWPVDRRRVYVVGHSNGGSMAFRLVNRASEAFTAMASVAGHCYEVKPAPAVPLPTLFMVGSEDPLMPLGGGRSVLPWEVRETPPFRWTTDRWAQAMGCSSRPSLVENLPDVTRVLFGPAPNQAVLLTLIVLRQGHHWPGAPDFLVDRIFLGPNHSPVKATPTIWAFFDKYVSG